MISASEDLEVGSAFKRTEPARMNGSCGMAVIRDRIISRGRVERSRLSIRIVPSVMSTRRRKTERRVLLPLFLLVGDLVCWV